MRDLVKLYFSERNIVNHHTSSFNDFLATADNPNSRMQRIVDDIRVPTDDAERGIIKLDPEGIENGALTIFGEFGSNTHNAFVRSHPEIAVDVSGDYTSDIEKLTQAMVSDTGAYDVLLMGLSYMPVERLIEKLSLIHI